MNKLVDKLIVFIICLIIYINYFSDIYIIVPVIIAITVSALDSYIEDRRFVIPAFCLYCAVCMFRPEFIYLLPVICYDVFSADRRFLPAAALPIIANLALYSKATAVFNILLIALSCFINYRTASLEKLKSEYIEMRDSAKEFSMQLESKNRELLQKQDYEVRLATLNERNRIARDIHDSVGHLLSSAILQIGAMMAVTRDELFKERLSTLKDTLSTGMDSIRSSIHKLYDESVDLYTAVFKLVSEFKFCPATLDYDIDSNPDTRMKYAFIAVIKESLSNIIKHSDATAVSITLREHPALYQLIIKDNGTKKPETGVGGIGLNTNSK